jgi:Leucine-rich repeat (LRR) protein
MQLSSSLADFTARLDAGPSGLADAKSAVAAAAATAAAEVDLQQMGLTDGDLSALLPLLASLAAHVTTLNLFLNEVEVLPAGLGAALPHLRKLLVGANPLRSIDGAALAGLTELEELDVGFSEQLTRLPASVGECTALRVLHAGNGRVAELPDELFACRNLEELHVYGNSLAELPRRVGRLTKLRVLSAGRNQLKALPAELAECKSLETLHVYENELRKFPPGIDALPSLRVVNAENNQELPTVPRDIRVECSPAKVAAFYAA